MAVAPEDMTFDDMEAACAGHFCRALPKAFVSAPLPRGSWNHTNFPMMEVQEFDLTPMTHFIEVITGHRMETPFEDVELNYKKAIDTQDLQLLPPPFGPKTMVPRGSNVPTSALSSNVLCCDLVWFKLRTLRPDDFMNLTFEDDFWEYLDESIRCPAACPSMSVSFQ